MEKTADSIAIGDDGAIALWNPTAAVLWSLVFTPAFGAWLHMRNRERLGQPDQARQARYWFAGMLLIAIASYAAGAAGALVGLAGIVRRLGCRVGLPADQACRRPPRGSHARRWWAAPILVRVAAICAIPFAAGVVTAFRLAAG